MPSPNSSAREVVEGALEVGHRDALVDREALDLVEDRHVRGVELVGAEHPAGHGDVDGHARARACVRTCTGEVCVRSTRPRLGRVDEERVLHLPRRVVGVEVQRVEVEPLGLDLGALGDLPAHADEQVGDALAAAARSDAGAPSGRAAGRQRDVDGLLGEDALVALGLELGLAGGERLGDPARGPGRRACRPRPWRSAAGRRSRGWPGPAGSCRPGGRCGRPSARRGRSPRRPRRARLGDGVRRGLGVERGDLDGVVAGVGSRHGVHFGRGWGAPESRCGRAGTEVVWPPGGGADGSYDVDAVLRPALSARGRPGPRAR